ncbi:MAG: DUF1080 domain-containing protein [Bacteroidales bacterium]|nr:DUF1080 domain-containing protein [Bacteroidales bacterium]MBN2699641.1 DUF1080 domain-containing protein [Bacteroidales bacterium]
MNRFKANLLLVLIPCLISPGILSAQTTYTVNPDNVLHTIDKKVYGHFLEHIYNSVNGGLWGEQVWNRSFEMTGSLEGIWEIEDETIFQSSLAENIRLMFGDKAWADYELSLQAKRTDGAEGFLVMFRADGDNFYWFNAGGWSNTSHAIEKGISGQGRWGVLDELQVPGAVETEQWYNVSIRCEGNHFQVKMDGNTLFDFTDDAAHLTGCAGIGTWATRSAFRNIVVRGIPGGDTLFSGLPVISSETESVFDHWEKSGSPAIYASGDALNNDLSVRIVNRSAGEAGLKQDEFHIKSQRYTGSLWARGSCAGTLKVRLLNQSFVMAEQDLGAPGAEWQEYPLQLHPTSSIKNGTLEIVITDTGTVYLDQVSLMGQDAIDNHGFRPDLYAAIDSLRPPVIRWPGGYFAELYRWKDGIGPQHERRAYPIEAWNDRDVNSYGTDEFMTMCEQLGAEPLLVINIGHRYHITPQQEYIEEAQHWVEYCNGDTSTTWGAVRKANGHPEPYRVKLWEISNEIWLTRDVNVYINYLKVFVPALKAIDPEIKIIACGSGSFDQNWNIALLNECADLIDYISTHHYEAIENYRSGVIQYHDFLESLSQHIQNSSNPDIRIYMSEWNVWSPIDWRCGLYAGGMLNTFEKQGEDFEIGGPALFLRHQNAGSAWNNAFINFNNTGWFPAPNYVVMKLWRDHYAPFFIETTGSHPDLNVVSTLSADTTILYFKIINTSFNDIPVTLQIDPLFVPGSATMKEITAESLNSENTLQNPDNIRVRDGSVSVNEQSIQFISVANSAAVVTIIASDSVHDGVNPSPGMTGTFFLENHPNPFKNQTIIHYTIDKTENVLLRIIDRSGRTVTVLVDDTLNPGHYRSSWDGKDSYGNELSSGTYLCELFTSSERSIRKMIFLK